MLPELFTIGGFTVYTYGVILAIAYLIAIFVTVRLGKKAGFDPKIMIDTVIIIIISAIVGAKLFYILGHLGEMIEDPGRLLGVLRAGGVFQGGLIMAAVVGIGYLIWKKQPVWKFADAVAPGVALGQAIGRLGCFCAGCCYGKPADPDMFPWAVIFPQSSVSAPGGVHLHPVQLYESLIMFGIFGFLLWMWKNRKWDGQVFWMYVIVYAIARGGILEWFRGDHGAVFLGLSGQQLLAVVSLIIGAVVYFYLARKNKRVSN